MVECSHAYTIPKGPFRFCLHCKKIVQIEEQIAQEAALQMPPHIFGITERLWSIIKPWPLMPFDIVKKYGWYISILGTTEYLIMPVFKEGKPIYYSARRLGKDERVPKYRYPEGVKKVLWASGDVLQSPVFICEGVADAAYCSLLGSSIAILGSYYNGSLDSVIAGLDAVVLLDGDSIGMLSAIQVAAKLQTVRSKKVVFLPNNADPTDFTIDELKHLIE